ncbi:cilia- and flagella-associated protein 44 isoform X2 [Strongylocentrotus purpuratus]|uniref:Cilia- and flagella-associated protein 44 n=1 Tax=Strongylocentrotus purpuratus TaxID=7668 RepID=A0A7M7NAU7_STRPU|nr:cilia- and flagella-associated protein 44 isoform X2 [Strongylocentrotus purpuratus]
MATLATGNSKMDDEQQANAEPAATDGQQEETNAEQETNQTSQEDTTEQEPANDNAETAEVSQEGGADAPATEGADDPQNTEGDGEQKAEQEGGGENTDAVEPPIENAPEDGQAPEADAPQAAEETAPEAQAEGEQGVTDGDAAPAAEGATEADTPQETQGDAPQETQDDTPQDAPAEGQGETQGEAPQETPAAEPTTEPPTESQQPQADTGGDGEPKPQDAPPQQQPEGGETQADGGGAEETEGEKGEESKEEVDENLIPKDFFYDYEEHSSKPVIAEDSGLPNDMLKLFHSFGYDCKKLSNLYMLDANTVLFAAGNIVQILNLVTKEQRYVRTTSGGGVGAITVHPSLKYFVVAEKGDMPNIIFYEYPSLKLYRILRGGTEKGYAFVDFNPAGTLLASVGCNPDFMLTLWDWQQEKIQLRSKAFSQDVFRVTFSPENEGQLTTSGTGHIRFWKMADTFTGLKLQGALGKFGRTEISDIRGYVELPDGKVLSGTDSGNMLLWEGGLIKVQIGRKGKKPCHQGAIEQFVMDEGELITIGADGFIRVWDFESIDTADSMDESGVFEMEPMNDLKVGNDVHLMSMVKSVDPEVQSLWYGQDANGGIWKLDLSFSHTTKDPEKLFSYHAGEITAVATSPISQLIASTAHDATVRVYDNASKTPLCHTKFNAGSTSLLWLPQIIDPKGATVLAGFNDGVVRVLVIARQDHQDHHKKGQNQPQAQLILKQAFKPHTKAVTAMALDNKGELLASGGADGTVFFMSVSDTFSPVGYIEMPGPVTHLTWAPGNFEKNTLLVFCANGEVMEVTAPEPGSYDTSKTFNITGLETRSFSFTSIKSRLRREEEEERKRIEEEEKQKEKERQRRIRRERGLEDEEEEEEEEEKEEEPQPLYIPEEPSPILFGMYAPNDPDTFWVSMGAFDAGYLYECKFYSEEEKTALIKDSRENAIKEAKRAIPVPGSDDIPITCITFNSEGTHALMGMENGVIRIQFVVQDNDPKNAEKRPFTSSQADLSKLGPYWMLNVHDNNYGSISTIETSFDDKCVVSSGGDGNLFIFEMMSDEKIEEAKAVARAKIPSARKEDEQRTVADIENKEHYSIELEKQKAEHDKMMKIAEEKKLEARKTIAKLRRQFKKLLERNHELPSHLQLERKEFEMDPGIRRELERQTAEKIDLVRKELAWEADKHRVGLEKLKQRFKDELECERIVVVAVRSSHQVATYRTAELSKDFLLQKEEWSRRATMVSEKSLSRDPTREQLFADQSKLSETEIDAGRVPGTQTKKATLLTGRLGEKVNKALQKAEKVKQKRTARAKQWNELNKSKPPEDYEDPADVSAIKEAQDHMGDFKLKTAKDYVVPEHLRMNALKKRNQLLTLEELIHTHKMQINRRVIRLRDKKVSMIQEIKTILEELEDIQSSLQQEQTKPVPELPVLHPFEVPEKKYEYTRESLMKFREEMKAKELAKITGGEGGGFGGGFGGMGGGNAAPQKADAKGPSPAMLRKSAMSYRSGTNLVTPIPSDPTLLSPLEYQLKEVHMIDMLYRQDQLLGRIEELVVNFDAELRLLRHEKFNQDLDLKNADLRRVTLFEELQLLKEFEKRENVLAAKVDIKIKERSDMQAKVVECQMKLDGKRKDIEKQNEREKALYATFQSSLGENNKFQEFLTKVFKKKIKRAKKKAKTEGESDEESDESSDDESDWSSDDDESGEEQLDDSVCPPGCDQALFDNTCALREKRLDIEELMAEEKKTAESLKKETDALIKKQKIIENGLKTAEADLEQFQLEKQQKLNELDVIVTLRLHQVEHVVNGAVPQDLSQCLVFTNQAIRRLQQRIRELKEEKTAQRRHYKEHRQQHVQLIKDRKLMESRINELEEKSNEMMRLKFGRIVDLDKMETVGVNRNVEELKEKLRINEGGNAQEIQKWEKKILAKKKRITELTRDNTERLQQLTYLVGENKDLEKALDSRQTSLTGQKSGGEFQGSRKADVVERKRLIQLVQLQAQEIEALKEEIGLLSRKGGHILPPTQPPAPHTPHGVRSAVNGHN